MPQTQLEFPISTFPEGKRYSFSLELGIEEAGMGTLVGDGTLFAPIRLDGEAYRTNQEVLLTLDVKVMSELTCGRCLDPVPTPLHAKFHVLYRPSQLRPDHWEDEEEVGLAYYEDGIIDLCEDIRRFLLLEMPLWPVCHDDCKGLCHVCGTNLNAETCDHVREDGTTSRRKTALADQLDRLFGSP